MTINISTSTLFHYTKSIDNLISILQNGFYPRYCPESIKYSNLDDIFPPQYVVPMVCFCDIPLSQTNEHTKKYNEYGIGLTKNWGYEKGITPITYFHANSTIIDYSNEMYHLLQKLDDGVTKEKTLLNWGIQRFGYLKSEKGAMWDGINQKFKEGIENFYNEREWRYIPANHTSIPTKDLPFPLYMPYKTYINLPENKYDELNQKLNTKPLLFRPKDIQFIIVSEDAEIPQMVDKLEEIMTDKTNKYQLSDREIKILITKIISMQQIRNNF